MPTDLSVQAGDYIKFNQVVVGNNCTYFICNSNHSISIIRNMYDCNKFCVYFEWSSWSTCPECSMDKTYRNRIRFSNSENNMEISCSEIDEAILCDIPKCNCTNDYDCECVLSEWASWTECSKSCGLGSKYRERSYISKGLNCSYEKLSEYQDCNPQCCPGKYIKIKLEII